MGLAIALLFSLPCSPPATELHKFTLRERVGHDWNDELVHYPVSFARGECRPDELQLEDEEGQPIPLQLTDVEAQPDGSVARGKVAFIVTLPAGATRTFTLGKGPKKTDESKTDLAAVVEGNSLVLSTSAIGVKLAWGEEKFDPPRAAAGVPAPDPAVPVAKRRLEWERLARDPTPRHALLREADGRRPRLQTGPPSIRIPATRELGTAGRPLLHNDRPGGGRSGDRHVRGGIQPGRCEGLPASAVRE
jgi:hypothetical protein